jgi:hypothetical protein
MESQYVEHEDYNVKPSVITYITAIRAIGNSLNPNAPEIAEDILRNMYKLSETSKLNVVPNASVWNAVITCFSKSGARSRKLANAKKAEHLLVEMLKRSQEEDAIEPNVRTW